MFSASSPATGTTRFLYDGDDQVGEYDASGTITNRYMHGPGSDEPILWDIGSAMNCTGGSTRFLHTNHQGSVIAVADCNGNRVAVNSYDEYGIPAGLPSATATNPANTGRFQYTGQLWMPELGLYYYKARMYSPFVGRFMQTDPIGYEDQVSLYAYVGNDPVNSNDSSGKRTTLITSYNKIAGVTIGDHTAIFLSNTSDGKVLLDPAGGAYQPRGLDGQKAQRGTVYDYFTDDQASLKSYVEAQRNVSESVRITTINTSRSEEDAIFSSFKSPGNYAPFSCATTCSSVLKTVPGINNFISGSFFPGSLANQFARSKNVIRDVEIFKNGSSRVVQPNLELGNPFLFLPY